MKKIHPLQTMIQKSKAGQPVGIYSACTANEIVLEACMERAKQTNTVLLIESTSNQVNQYGGYTGMTPTDFYVFVMKIAERVGLPFDSIILGGDHLGPLTWTHLEEKEAMEEASELVKQYVLAGFTKIHLDTSMRLACDSLSEPLATKTIARRGAILAKVAEDAYQELKQNNSNVLAPMYIVGSEVPIPGGAHDNEEGIQVTSVSDFKDTVNTFKTAFEDLDLSSAWERVIGVVVQPGVEFADITIHEYNKEAAKDLSLALHSYPTVVFEGHSTDYQSRSALKEMVNDGIAILKVGPGLTFAFREGLFALAHMEAALFAEDKQSHFIHVLDEAMLNNPKYWASHYHGTSEEIALKRKYSYSDRCRYYLPDPQVQTALSKLLDNLSSISIPLSLVSQYMPIQYEKVRNHSLTLDPYALLKDRVINCVDDYLFATKQELL